MLDARNLIGLSKTFNWELFGDPTAVLSVRSAVEQLPNVSSRTGGGSDVDSQCDGSGPRSVEDAHRVNEASST